MEIRSAEIPEHLADEISRRILTYSAALTVYHCVCVNYGESIVGVFGDGASGAYEWFVWNEDERKLRTSDVGFGNDCAALCCGLVASGARMANGDHDLRLTWTKDQQVTQG